jgi:hypothetical protein
MVTLLFMNKIKVLLNENLFVIFHYIVKRKKRKEEEKEIKTLLYECMRHRDQSLKSRNVKV